MRIQTDLVQVQLTGRFARPVERTFSRHQREHTTVLFGGLTWKHERLVQASLRNLGYNATPLPDPDVAAFQAGKEYGNNGQCNPTYFTVGNLVRYLQRLQAEGLSRREIQDRYVFLTAGACGPCRFGMYEAEYRLALQNSGFDGFRVLLFDLGQGMEQDSTTQGLLMNQEFFLGILNALNAADVLNEVAALLRPFELDLGAAQRALTQAIETFAQSLEKSTPLEPRWIPKKFHDSARLLRQLSSGALPQAMDAARQHFGPVMVERLRVKPVVKVIGEFWAQTTEGDGNYRMFSFLENDGAQVLSEPISSLILYMIHQARQFCRDRKGLQPGLRRKRWKLGAAEALFRHEYGRLLSAAGGLGTAPVDQYKLQKLAHPYYNSRAAGGEGHVEVGKNLYYSRNKLAHMVLSLKPFGCMPSSQSDGVQAALVAQERGMIYLPLETSGEGEINAHSRVQMALSEARAKANAEFEGILGKTGWPVSDLHRFIDDHPEIRNPFYKIPAFAGVTGHAARTATHIADRAARERWSPKTLVAVG